MDVAVVCICVCRCVGMCGVCVCVCVCVRSTGEDVCIIRRTLAFFVVFHNVGMHEGVMTVRTHSYTLLTKQAPSVSCELCSLALPCFTQFVLHTYFDASV